MVLAQVSARRARVFEYEAPCFQRILAWHGGGFAVGTPPRPTQGISPQEIHVLAAELP